MVMAKVKVSQATIDKIKAMGMTKALKGASKASPEMREALTRMYGARRVSAAGGSSKPAAKSADAARAAAMKPKATGGKYVGSRFVANTPAPKKPSASGVVYKSADAARAAATNKKPSVRVPSATGFGAYNMPNKPGARGKAETMPNKPGAKGKIVNMPNRKPATNPAAKAVVSILSGQGLRANNGMTAAQVAAENKRRAAAVAAAKKKK
jgi:hypothetical protein